MERCPCCKSRLRESTICPRCRADLNEIVNAQQSAEVLLALAIQYWMENKIKQSIDTLEHSIYLKKTDLAITFRGFLIEQQSLEVLQQLAQKKILAAKNQLFKIRILFPYSELLRQLNDFTDYLLLKNYHY